MGDLSVPPAADGAVADLLPPAPPQPPPIRVAAPPVSPLDGVVLAFGDFDGDHRRDLVAQRAALPQRDLQVWPGAGDGRFLRPAAASGPVGVVFGAAGDFDGDGRDDLALASRGGGMMLLRSLPDGTFRIPPGAHATGGTPTAMAPADLDGDGRLDLVLANLGTADVGVYLNSGGGVLADETRFAAGPHPRRVVAADVILDGKLDLVVLCDTGVLVLRGQGGGRFDAPLVTPLPSPAEALAVADLDLDGHADVVVGPARGGTLQLLAGRGDGSFQVRPGPTPRGALVAVAPLAGDHLPDAVAAGPAGVEVLLGDPGRPEGFEPPVLYPTSGAPGAVEVADHDGDRRPDVVVELPAAGRVVTLGGRAAGALAAPLRVAGAGPITSPPATSMATAAPTWWRPTRRRVRVLLGAAGGSWTEAPAVPLGGCSVALADLDGDGLPDLLTGCGAPSFLSTLRGTPGGSFAAPVGGSEVADLRVALVEDLDGDGRPDLATARPGAARWRCSRVAATAASPR